MSARDDEQQRSSSPTDDEERQGDSAELSNRRPQLLDRFTWANFTCTQSTGGVAILLSETPHQFAGLQTIGVVMFILNLVLFVAFTTAITCRFLQRPSRLRRSVTQPPEAYFTGSFWLSIATIIICMQQFGAAHTGSWIVVALRVLFWIYAAVTLTYNITIFVVMFSRSPLTPGTMSPPMFLMIFNAMLTGTVASAIAADQPPEHRMPIIVAGVAYQGLGWILCLILLPIFIGSMLINGLGAADQRPGLFMPVGSSGYTIVALIGCAKAIPEDYGYFAKHPTAVEVLPIVALWSSIFLWLFTFWLFAVALVAQAPIMFPKLRNGKLKPRMNFTLPWWALIFPNVGFTIATIYIGQELESDAILWVAKVMTVLVFAAWVMDFSLHMKYIFQRRIM